jgi:hypothetical protein
MDSSRAAHPLLGLVPPIAIALHPPTAATAEVCVAAELQTGDLCALRGIELDVELHNEKFHLS